MITGVATKEILLSHKHRNMLHTFCGGVLLQKGLCEEAFMFTASINLYIYAHFFTIFGLSGYI